MIRAFLRRLFPKPTVAERRVLLSWRLAQQVAPRRWWLDAWVAIDGRMRRAWLESAKRGARRAAERAS